MNSDLNDPVPAYALLAILAFGLAAFAAIVLWNDARNFIRTRKENRHARRASANPFAVTEPVHNKLFHDRTAAVRGGVLRAGNDDGDAGNTDLFHFLDAESLANAFGDVCPDGTIITFASTERGYDAFPDPIDFPVTFESADTITVADGIGLVINPARTFSGNVRDGRQNGDRDDLASGEQSAHGHVPQDEHDSGVDHPHRAGDVQ